MWFTFAGLSLLSLLVIYYSSSKDSNIGSDLLKKWKFIIPPFIQVIALSIQYIGLTMAAASVTQMMYASAVLWTAFFSLILLKKRFTSTQCFAIGAITVGTSIVGISTALLSGQVNLFWNYRQELQQHF